MVSYNKHCSSHAVKLQHSAPTAALARPMSFISRYSQGLIRYRKLSLGGYYQGLIRYRKLSLGGYYQGLLRYRVAYEASGDTAKV